MKSLYLKNYFSNKKSYVFTRKKIKEGYGLEKIFFSYYLNHLISC